MYYILSINPGSTSTKIAVYEDEKLLHQENIAHSKEEIDKYPTLIDQKPMRKERILDYLKSVNFDVKKINVVVGRGGLVRPIPTGTYEVTENLKKDLIIGYTGTHASNLGGLLADEIAKEIGVKAYITDPVACDEMDDVARISGLPMITRRSNGHYLNTKAVLRRVVKENGFDLKDNFIVCHLGGGISITPNKEGRVVDINNALEGGPFSPDRAGTLPVGDLAALAFSGKYTEKELLKLIQGNGGLMAYLGTNDGREVTKRIEEGDEKAKLIFEAMAYQISKEVGMCAAVLHGKVKAIILTGGLAYGKLLDDLITERVKFIAPVIVMPGEDEMLALSEAGLRILRGEEKSKDYDQEAKIID